MTPATTLHGAMSMPVRISALSLGLDRGGKGSLCLLRSRPGCPEAWHGFVLSREARDMTLEVDLEDKQDFQRH